jgi:hypothetical protein
VGGIGKGIDQATTKLGAGLGAAVGGIGEGLGAAVGGIGGGLGAAVGDVGGLLTGLVGNLTSAGVPERDANIYAEGVRRGGTLVAASVADAQAPIAREILQRHRCVDPMVLAAANRESGWGDKKTEAEGAAEKAAGKVQNAAGGAKDAVKDHANH